jgi:hypothetical protein
MKAVPSLAALRERLRSLSFEPGQVKTASLGGSADAPFEMAFSNLAHSFVRDKAPKLMQYLIGFQLLSKNEDNTKAVGVFGFKVGNQWLLAPVFFLNGELKGHELLYIKQQDSFLPMAEEWVDTLLEKKPMRLGDSVDRNLSLLGAQSPNFNQLSRSPDKSASAVDTRGQPKMASWARECLPQLAYLATTPTDQLAKYADLKTLPDFLRDAGPSAVRYLVEKVGTAYPELIEAIDRFYGPAMLDAAVRSPANRPVPASRSLFKTAAPSPWRLPRIPPGRTIKRSSVTNSLLGPMEALPKGVKHKVVDKVEAKLGPAVLHDLSKDEKETLLKARVVYRDTRDDKEVTIAYNVQGKLSLRNPDETGIYEVLVQPDTFERLLIVMAPYRSKRRVEGCLVIRLDGDKTYTTTHPANVWIQGVADREAWKKWYDALPDADDIPLRKDRDTSYKNRDRRRFVILSANGEGTLPLRADEKYDGGGDPSVSYDVCFETHRSGRRPGNLPPLARTSLDDYDSHIDDYSTPGVVLTKRPGQLRINTGRLEIPDGCKRLEVQDEITYGENASKPLRLGNLIDVQIAVAGHTHPLKIVSDGKDVTVDDQRSNKEAAVAHLFLDHGLRKEAAEELVERALRERKVEVALVYPPYIEACWAKAAGNEMIDGAPSAPSFPEPERGSDPGHGDVPTRYRSEYNIIVPDMSSGKTDRATYNPLLPDVKAMQSAMSAAQSGQKEVFDTAMLGGLLKTLRDDNMVDRYIGDLMKGLDRLGRILFLYYWHGEQFEDRYGKQDMPQLEDGLRNAFEGLGDIVLALKRKNIDPDDHDIDLSDIANQG